MLNELMPKNEGQPSLLDRCLKPLLKWLKWDGNERMIFESLPHLMSIQTIGTFCWAMKNLGYTNNTISLSLKHLDARLLPCLFVPHDGSSPKVLIEKVGEDFSVFDSEMNQSCIFRDLDVKGIVIVFKKQNDILIKVDQRHWFRGILLDEKKLFFFSFFLTLIQTFLLLATPLYIIELYDKIIYSSSHDMLLALFIGVMISVILLTFIMGVRARILGHIGTHLQKNIGNVIFKQLLRLPPSYTENASVTNQIIRLNDFNSIRDFFGSPLFGAFIELPFTLILFAVVWFIGGMLIIIPAVAILVSIFIAYVIWRVSQKTIHVSAMVKATYQDFLLESLWGMRSLQYAGLQKKWQERFAKISAKTILSAKNILQTNSLAEAIFDVLTTITGLATLVTGTIMVIDKKIEIGALIGTMFIIWRILSPIKSLNMMLPKLIQLRFSIKQINELMHLPIELPTERQWKNTPQHIVGSISFSQLSFRYPGADTPALKNITFTLDPGKMMMVIGPTASGKSTIANLILAIYLPQSGHIFVDNRNIRQFDVNLLRKNIAYVPQKAELFYGTIKQNLLLAQPLASNEQLIEAARIANLLDDIQALPEGFNTRIKFYGDDKLGPSFCQKINLARAYLRDAPILVMDEPMSTLDANSIDVFLNFLRAVKSKKSIIMFAHNTAHIALADTAIILYDGYIVTAGEPDVVLKNIPPGIL